MQCDDGEIPGLCLRKFVVANHVACGSLFAVAVATASVQTRPFVIGRWRVTTPTQTKRFCRTKRIIFGRRGGRSSNRNIQCERRASILRGNEHAYSSAGWRNMSRCGGYSVRLRCYKAQSTSSVATLG